MSASKRDELVRKALKVFYDNGFHATGMDRLVAETGISKTSMYKHFRSKEDIIQAALRLRDEQLRNWLIRRTEERAKAPAERLLALFDVLGEWFAQKDFSGCMFIKASSEYLSDQHPIRATSAEHKLLLLTYIRQLAEQAGAREPALLARQLLLLKEGAIVTAHLLGPDGVARDARVAAAALVNQAIPESDATYWLKP